MLRYFCLNLCDPGAPEFILDHFSLRSGGGLVSVSELEGASHFSLQGMPDFSLGNGGGSGCMGRMLRGRKGKASSDSIDSKIRNGAPSNPGNFNPTAKLNGGESSFMELGPFTPRDSLARRAREVAQRGHSAPRQCSRWQKANDLSWSDLRKRLDQDSSRLSAQEEWRRSNNYNSYNGKENVPALANPVCGFETLDRQTLQDSLAAQTKKVARVSSAPSSRPSRPLLSEKLVGHENPISNMPSAKASTPLTSNSYASKANSSEYGSSITSNQITNQPSLSNSPRSILLDRNCYSYGCPPSQSYFGFDPDGTDREAHLISDGDTRRLHSSIDCGRAEQNCDMASAPGITTRYTEFAQGHCPLSTASLSVTTPMQSTTASSSAPSAFTGIGGYQSGRSTPCGSTTTPTEFNDYKHYNYFTFPKEPCASPSVPNAAGASHVSNMRNVRDAEIIRKQLSQRSSELLKCSDKDVDRIKDCVQKPDYTNRLMRARVTRSLSQDRRIPQRASSAVGNYYASSFSASTSTPKRSKTTNVTRLISGFPVGGALDSPLPDRINDPMTSGSQASAYGNHYCRTVTSSLSRSCSRARTPERLSSGHLSHCTTPSRQSGTGSVKLSKTSDRRGPQLNSCQGSAFSASVGQAVPSSAKRDPDPNASRKAASSRSVTPVVAPVGAPRLSTRPSTKSPSASAARTSRKSSASPCNPLTENMDVIPPGWLVSIAGKTVAKIGALSRFWDFCKVVQDKLREQKSMDYRDLNAIDIEKSIEMCIKEGVKQVTSFYSVDERTDVKARIDLYKPAVDVVHWLQMYMFKTNSQTPCLHELVKSCFYLKTEDLHLGASTAVPSETDDGERISIFFLLSSIVDPGPGTPEPDMRYKRIQEYLSKVDGILNNVVTQSGCSTSQVTQGSRKLIDSQILDSEKLFKELNIDYGKFKKERAHLMTIERDRIYSGGRGRGGSGCFSITQARSS